MIKNEFELKKSSISWPFTSRGNILVFAATLTVVAIAIALAEACDHSAQCSKAAWPSNLFGQRKVEHKSYCEVQRFDRLMSEHANSISNVVYCFIGVLIIACGIGDAARCHAIFPMLRVIIKESNCASAKDIEEGEEKAPSMPILESHLRSFPFFSLILGTSTVLLGIGSFMLHSYDSDFTRHLDIGGVYLVFVALCFYALSLFWPNNESLHRTLLGRVALITCVGAIDVVLIALKRQIDSRTTFSTFAALLLVITILQLILGHLNLIKTRFRQLGCAVLCVVFLATAVLSWAIDRNRTLCYKDSFLQGHSLWHVSSAAALMTYYCFLRSEYSTH